MRKGVQIYTVRDYIQTPQGYRDSLTKIRDIGYDAVQTYGWQMPDREHKAFLQELGLKMENVGADYEELIAGSQAIDKAVAQADFYETPYISLGTLPVELRDSREGFLRYAQGINDIGKTLKKQGKKLLYHPHALEFFSFGDGNCGFDILMEDTDPDVFWFTLDTHWIQAGGKNPQAIIRRAKGRLPIIHFKDYKIVGGAQPIEQVCKAFGEVGQGNLDWPGIIAACREIGVQSAVVEQDICPGNPFDSLEISYKNMVKFGL